MLNEVDSFADIFRGGLPYCLLVALPILILCSPSMASDFQVMSMTKFDVNGEQFGTFVNIACYIRKFSIIRCYI